MYVAYVLFKRCICGLGFEFCESPFREIIPPFHFCETAICFARSMFIVFLAVLRWSISGKVFRHLADWFVWTKKERICFTTIRSNILKTKSQNCVSLIVIPCFRSPINRNHLFSSLLGDKDKYFPRMTLLLKEKNRFFVKIYASNGNLQSYPM